MDQEHQLTILEKRFRALGTALGLTEYRCRRAGMLTELYLFDRRHALQLEIDWRDNELFLYAVCLRDGKLPVPEVIYRHADGKQCRTFLETVYRKCRPRAETRRNRNEETHFAASFDFYETLILSAPGVLLEFFEGMHAAPEP